MAIVKLELSGKPVDGQHVTFKAPCDCTAVTGLRTYYAENNERKSMTFTMKDAHNNDLTGIGNLFGEGSLVEAVLNVTDKVVYLLNAATNGYLEAKIPKTASDVGAIPKTYIEFYDTTEKVIINPWQDAHCETLIKATDGNLYKIIFRDDALYFERIVGEETVAFWNTGNKFPINIIPNTDYNALDRTGYYELQGNCPNNPYGSGNTNTHFYVEHFHHAYVGYNKQIAYCVTNEDVFQRTQINGTWSAWKPFYTGHNVTCGTEPITAGTWLATDHVYQQYE